MSEPETVRIAALGALGEGIAHIEGETVFVPGALAGEAVRITRQGQRGTLAQILEPSAARIAPFCPHFARCGGCQIQHLAPQAYAEWKRGLAVHALEAAGVAAQVAPLVPAHGMGRRRATLHAQTGSEGPIAGYTGLRSHAIADIDHCPILAPGLKEAPDMARGFAALLGPCDMAVTETAQGPDIALKTKDRVRPAARDLARVAERFGICRVALGGEVLLTYRTPDIAMGRARVPLPVGSFLQATQAVQDALADLIVENAKGARFVADLFCGLGPFALRLAEHAPVYAADSDRAAIAALQAGAKRGKKLKPITAEARELFAEPLTRFELNRFDTVVLDPPRAGAKAQIAQLAKSGVKTVLYVSCDPKSFARDAAALIGAGFAMGPVTPLDQFAYSRHLEVFARFSR